MSNARPPLVHDPKVISAVLELRERGLSHEAIAAQVGIGKTTVGRILDQAGLRGVPTGLCRHGHRLEGDNLRLARDGNRGCRACKLERDRRWRRARGIVPREEYIGSAASSKNASHAARARQASAARVSPPKIPMEVRLVWTNAKPGSAIRRLFPTTADLARAAWDPHRETLVRAA